MKYNNLIILLVIIFLFNTVLVSADSLYLTDTVEGPNYGPGRIKTYTIDGNEYTFRLVGCDIEQNKCSTIINDKTTGPLSISDTYDLNDNYYFKIDSITFDFCGDVQFCDLDFRAYDIAEFSIYSRAGFCGDNNCDSGESCSSCPDDCGECQAICGDGICQQNEDCKEDNCCDGIVVDLNNDINNCGNCSNVCYSNQTCIGGICTLLDGYCGDGVCNEDENCGNCIGDCNCSSIERCENNQCVTYCGNGVCSLNEDYTNCSVDCSRQVICGDDICDDNEECCKDCGCDTGFECANNTCVSLDECATNDDCDDNNNCTKDICSGIPKKCFNVEIEGCGEVNVSMAEITSTLIEEERIIKNKTAESREIKEISTQEKKDIGLIQRVINWIKNLFELK